MSQPGGKQPRTPESMEQLLRRHHQVLAEVGKVFDSGTDAMALPLAVSIRTLLHDAERSKSLLGQLNVKSTVRFVDTADHIDPRNVLPTFGLVISSKRGREPFRWEAPLDVLAPIRNHPPLPFDQWWTSPVANDVNGNAWSRQNLVLNLANKEGGAHVDPLRDEDLRRLEESSSMGIAFADDLLGVHDPANGPYLPSVRQIAYEVQRTLEAELGHLLA